MTQLFGGTYLQREGSEQVLGGQALMLQAGIHSKDRHNILRPVDCNEMPQLDAMHNVAGSLVKQGCAGAWRPQLFWDCPDSCQKPHQVAGDEAGLGRVAACQAPHCLKGKQFGQFMQAAPSHRRVSRRCLSRLISGRPCQDTMVEQALDREILPPFS